MKLHPTHLEDGVSRGHDERLRGRDLEVGVDGRTHRVDLRSIVGPSTLQNRKEHAAEDQPPRLVAERAAVAREGPREHVERSVAHLEARVT